jgi:hypothetical protein
MSSRTIIIEFDPIAVGVSEIYGETAATITSIVRSGHQTPEAKSQLSDTSSG